jgi:hypothetical protein
MRAIGIVTLGWLGLAGCTSILGIQPHELAAADGGDRPADDSGSGSGSGGSSSGGSSGSSSGTSPETDAGEDADAAGLCTPGATICNGNTPQACVAGAWQSQTPCGGTKPLCSNGECGSFRVTGGIRSTAPVPPGDGGIRLVAGGFELGTRACDEAGVCVTGGIVP